MNCEYRRRGSSWALEEAKRTGQDCRKKCQKGYTSRIWEEAPIKVICIENCVVGDLLDAITCAKFQSEIFRVYHLKGVELSIFLFIFEWALQQCSATALPVMNHNACMVLIGLEHFNLLLHSAYRTYNSACMLY